MTSMPLQGARLIRQNRFRNTFCHSRTQYGSLIPLIGQEYGNAADMRLKELIPQSGRTDFPAQRSVQL